MYGRAGLDRFKKAQSLEPFSVSANSTMKPGPQTAFREAVTLNQSQGSYTQNHQNAVKKTVTTDVAPTQHVTPVGGGQSTWQPPDWAIEPRPGVYYLDVVKDGEVLDQVNLDKKRHIFGRQFHACDFVLDHQSVSRQHAAVVPHKDGSVYVIDLGSAHGTFVANERLSKDSPVELEVGQSLKFAASTRIYVLRKNNAALFPPPLEPTEIELPPPPDPSDEEAVLAYNTYVNRALNGLLIPNLVSKSTGSSSRSSVISDDSRLTERASKRMRRTRVAFKDQVGGELVEVVGFSDGADVETEPGPTGVKEGSLVGKYESLVKITVIPKGKEHTPIKQTFSTAGVTEKLQQVLNKVKAPAKSGGIYDDLYGDSFSVKVGSSWAHISAESGGKEASPSKSGGNTHGVESEKSRSYRTSNDDDNDDDLFG